MKSIFKPGDRKIYQKVVMPADSAAFDAGMVHPVYATFALARDAEWACRLFVLEMKEVGEEGIGTFISVEHLSPALIGEKVEFEAVVKSIERNEIICTYTAKAGERVIARGEQGQKILPKVKLDRIFESLEKEARAEH
jgi:predicted thioesterase